MSNFFSIDSPMWSFFNKLANIFILNLCFVAASIPVITIGASWTALYYVGMKMAKGEEKSVAKEFFHSFKDNFKQATIMWLTDLILLAFLILDLFIISGMSGTIKAMLHMAIMIIIAVLLCMMVYSFPLLAKFDNTLFHMYKNSFIMALRHIGFTAIAVVVTMVPLILFLMDATLLPALVMIYVFIGFGLSAYSNSFLFCKIFSKYM